MRKTRSNRHKKSSSKTFKFNMKGCARPIKCKKCNKIHKPKKGGCGGACQAGGTSLGFFQNIQNIGSNFFNGVLGVYNGIQTIPQPISGDPWKNQYAQRFNK